VAAFGNPVAEVQELAAQGSSQAERAALVLQVVALRAMVHRPQDRQRRQSSFNQYTVARQLASFLAL
jgi:hypothetical protein